MTGGSANVYGPIVAGAEVVFAEQEGTFLSLSAGVGLGTPEAHFIAGDDLPSGEKVKCKD